MPSSGVMVSLKLRTSLGSGKTVFIVEGRSSSVRSDIDNQPPGLNERIRDGAPSRPSLE